MSVWEHVVRLSWSGHQEGPGMLCGSLLWSGSTSLTSHPWDPFWGHHGGDSGNRIPLMIYIWDIFDPWLWIMGPWWESMPWLDATHLFHCYLAGGCCCYFLEGGWVSIPFLSTHHLPVFRVSMNFILGSWALTRNIYNYHFRLQWYWEACYLSNRIIQQFPFILLRYWETSIYTYILFVKAIYSNYYYYLQPNCKPKLIEQNAINPKAPAGKAVPRRKR